LGQKYFVNPILVFSNNRTTVKFGLYPQKGVVVVGKRFLRKAIFNERRKLSPERIKVISECLDRYVNKNK